MNKITNEHLVGQGRVANGDPVWIGYRTGERTSSGWPKGILAQVGVGPTALSLVVPASKMLTFKNIHEEWVINDGKSKCIGLVDEKDWFEHRCKEANCEWFVPMVKRMAAGEDVPLAEIQAAYLQHNGKPMPCGEWSKLFR